MGVTDATMSPSVIQRATGSTFTLHPPIQSETEGQTGTPNVRESTTQSTVTTTFKGK